MDYSYLLIKMLKLYSNIFYDHRLHENRKRICRNLYTITPCLRQMLSIWQSTYSKMSLVDVDELFNHSGTFDLAEFIVNKKIIISHSITYQICSE